LGLQRIASAYLFVILKSRELDIGVAHYGGRAETGETMWLALAAITLAAAIGFNVLALAIQNER
jgi:hypothetical protein